MNVARPFAAAILVATGIASAQTSPTMAQVKAALTAASTVEMCANISPQKAAAYRALHAAWRKSQETAVFESDKDYRQAEADVVDDMKKHVATMNAADRAKAAGICDTQLMPALRRGAGLPD